MLLRFIVLALVLSTGLARAAGNDFTLPTVSDLEKQITNGGQSSAANSGGQKSAGQTGNGNGGNDQQQVLQKTLQLRQEIDSNRDQVKSLKKQAQQAPQQKQQLQKQLDQARREKQQDWRKRYQSLSLSALTQELIDQLDALESNQQQLAQVSSKLTSSQTLPERAQSTISDSLARMDDIRQQLGNENTPSTLNKAQQTRLQTELTALDSRIELRNQELNVASTLEDMARLRKQLLGTQADTIQKRLDALQPLINEKRAAQLSTEVGDEQVHLPPALAKHPLLKAARQQNQALSDQIKSVGNEVNDLIRDGIASKTQLDRVRALSSTVNDQINMIDGSLLLSRILYEQQKSLPELKPQEGLQKRITDARLSEFDINQQRQDLDKDEPKIHDQSLTQDQRGQLRSALDRLMEARRQLLNQLDQELGRKLNVLVHLQLNQQQLEKITRNLHDTISEQTFWMPSTQPVSLEWFTTFPGQVKNEWQQMPWHRMAANGTNLFRQKWPWLFLPLVPALLLWFSRGRLRARVSRLNADIGFLKRDSQSHTPLTIIYTALMCAPGPLILSLLAWGLWVQPGTLTSVLGSALLKIGLLWLVFELCYRLLADNGIAQRQFRWSREKNLRLRRRLLVVGLTMVPMTLVIAFGEQWPAQLTSDRVGLVAMVVGLIVLSITLARAAVVYPSRRYSRAFKVGSTVLCAGIPLVLLALIGLGYYYTSVRLSGRMIDSFYMLLLWILFDAAAVRGLAVAAQRLAYKRAVAQREAEPKESVEGGVEVEEPQMDLQQINQQSLRLIRLALFAGFGVLLYLVWADILNAFSYTDNILLWSTTQGQGANITSMPVSLGDVISALAIGGFTILLASNLPGLLEVLLLSRLNLRQGASYATTTLLSYVIIVLGIVITLGSLGLSWAKLQWLVAALGVGLGFGLQEIFANFISGIIILFERPIRIGDVITIGDLSGTVSRIRIRATTVIDFDRKEIIIPNKAFVTERLINWSLSDTVTRMILTIGFAYGSDLAECRDILATAARDNKRVMKDPEPMIIFMAFGASTLDHELRVYVKDIGDRLPATDELNRHIDRLCREREVEIAFSQLDIHIRNSQGDILDLEGNPRDSDRPRSPHKPSDQQDGDLA